MTSLLSDIIKAIVEYPDDVSIQEDSSQADFIGLDLSVNPEDMGRVIGKEGKTIGAIRSLMRVAGRKKGVRVRVEIVEPKSTQHRDTDGENKNQTETD